jgi:copper chaperone CopZ
MIQFHDPDMTCGACANRISKALHQAGLAAGLRVDIDVGTRQVRLVGTGDAESVRKVRGAIEAAGYTAEEVADGLQNSSAMRVGGCCCQGRSAAHIDAHQSAATSPVRCCG